MARREYVTLSAALITCVMSVVVLSVSAYVLAGKLAREQARAAEAERQAAAAQARVVETQAEVGRLKEIIGHPRTAGLAAVEHAYRIDLAAAMPPATPGATPVPYRSLIYILLRAAQNAVAREVETAGAVSIVRAQLADAETRHQRQLEAEAKLRHALVQEVKDVRATAAAEYKREHATWESLFAEFQAKLKELAQWQDQYHALARRSAHELSVAQNRYDALRSTWENLTRYEFEQPYGRIVDVDARLKTVVLDLGAEDRLPRGLTLLVFDPETSNLTAKGAKARLEVTGILGPHLAQARFVEVSLRNPIVRGDVLYTAAWQPGRPRQFALAGVCDLTGNGRDDRAYLQKLVEGAGGAIVADVNADGERSGELSVNVRYLIVGRPPTGAGGDKKVLAYEKFLAEANALHIELVPLDKFLGLVGWPAPTQIVRLNSEPGARRPRDAK